ncbi:hypothetical protein DFH06DRAFT_1154160 [Mycena polygramma]|nr:hypothetical protein DFH06DRAFT_1154160 [Mycena polygramma]
MASFCFPDRILALFNEHWILFIILESLRDQHRLTGGGLAESILSLLFRWIEATRGMDVSALARRSFYDLLAQPVEGGLGIGDEEADEEAGESAADAKGKGKRRASDEPAGNSAKRRPHRETSVPSIVIMQDQGMDGADSSRELGLPTLPVEPPPSSSGYATTLDSTPPGGGCQRICDLRSVASQCSLERPEQGLGCEVENMVEAANTIWRSK